MRVSNNASLTVPTRDGKVSSMKYVRRINEEGFLEITSTLEYFSCEGKEGLREVCVDLMECEGKFFCDTYDGELDSCPCPKGGE